MMSQSDIYASAAVDDGTFGFDNVRTAAAAGGHVDVLKTGSLMKRGHVNKSWKQRWFTLEENTLSYYDKEGGKLRGKLYLIGVGMSIESRPDQEEVTSGRNHVFKIVIGEGAEKSHWKRMIPKAFSDEPDHANLDRKTLLLGTTTDKDMQDWIIKIKANWCGPEGQTYLMRAAEEGKADDVRRLCEAGADVNLQDNGGWTALMRAAGSGEMECMRVMLNFGTDPNMQTVNGSTAAMICVRDEQLGCLRFLVENIHADTTIVNDDGASALILAVQGGQDQLQILEFLIKCDKEHIDDKNLKGWNAMMFAAKGGLLDQIEVLLAAGADPNVVHGETGNSAAMWACIEGHNPVLKRLIQAGASLHHKNHLGQTMLFHAQFASNEQALQFLSVGLCEFHESPTDKRVNLGGTFSLTGVASGNPAPMFEWRYEGAKIDFETDGNCDVSDPVICDAPEGAEGAGPFYRSTFISKNVQQEEMGRYSCYASNDSGQMRSEICFVRETESPTVDDHPDDLIHNPGETAKVSCKFKADPPPTYQWYGYPVPRDDDSRNPEKRRQTVATAEAKAIEGATENTFEIAKLTLADDMLYFCTATNQGGSVSTAPARVSVNTPPSISKAQLRISTIMLKVTVLGMPEPEISWKCDTEVITRENKHEVEVSFGDPNGDTGPQNFNFVAKNTVGEIEVPIVTVPAA
jgi:ankyrin repeat protein